MSISVLLAFLLWRLDRQLWEQDVFTQLCFPLILATPVRFLSINLTDRTPHGQGNALVFFQSHTEAAVWWKLNVFILFRAAILMKAKASSGDEKECVGLQESGGCAREPRDCGK